MFKNEKVSFSLKGRPDEDATGDHTSIRLSLEGNKLVRKSITPLYLDFAEDEDRKSFFPGAQDCIKEYENIDGKLKVSSKFVNYRVNPETLEKTPIED